MDIIQKLQKNNIKILSIIGLSKNCGKTTTLIKIIDSIDEESNRICVTSIGIDGEKYDHLFLFEKPKIKLKKNFYAVTSIDSLKESSGKFTILKRFPIKTSKGELVLIKVEEEGEIEISGPYIGKDLQFVLDELKNFNFDLIIIDGAIDRKVSIKYSDGVILQTGLNIMDEKDKIIEETLFYKDIFTLKEVDSNLKEMIERNRKEFKYLYIFDDKIVGSNELESVDSKFLYINGALIDNILDEIKKRDFKKIVVEHPYNILISKKSFYDFKESGGEIYVLKSVNLLGVTFSPFNQDGIFNFDDEEEIFIELKEKLKPIEIFDPVKGR